MVHSNGLEKRINVKGADLIVLSGVFSPELDNTYSTTILMDNLPNVKNKSVIDMGCGTGIIGIYCALNGASKVIAADNNERAVENTKKNVIMNNVEQTVKVIKSDLFDNVDGSFDFIFGNMPINDEAWDR